MVIFLNRSQNSAKPPGNQVRSEKVCYVGQKNLITITVALIRKVREIFFLSGAKNIMGLFEGFFEGAEIFFTSKRTGTRH